MDEKTRLKYKEFKSHPTYIDILSYALAKTHKTHFTANSDLWHEAVYQICKKYGRKIPELKRIYFTRRPPLPPQSEQVDRLLKILEMSREIQMLNYRYDHFDMGLKTRRAIIKREEARWGNTLNLLKKLVVC